MGFTLLQSPHSMGKRFLGAVCFIRGCGVCVCVCMTSIYLVYALAVFIYTFLLLVYMSHRLEGAFKCDQQ